ncbi:MAG TPA: hypothetical protein PK560_00315 [bacterium]|nr:hypothetical protein [bacterium]HOG42504.1 hypothetical protein [bacterium]HPY14730.1 hypothetical protein [bacterium]
MKSLSKLKFTYIKNSNFITHHVDGLHGGMTPRGHLVMNFFSERFPIPNTVTHKIADGVLGDELEKESKDGIIREVVCGVVINLESAKSINEWLTARIKEMEKLSKNGKN